MDDLRGRLWSELRAGINAEAHLPFDVVVAFVDGELSLAEHERAAAHLAGCETCTAKAAAQRQARVSGGDPATQSTEDELDALVNAAIKGDRDAMERLLRVITPLVLRYVRARLGRQQGSLATADDVAQEVFRTVLTALPSYRDQERPFLAFVYGIAAHRVADAHRSAAQDRSEPAAEIPDAPDLEGRPEESAVQGELWLSERLEQLMAALAPKQREILRLRIVLGLSAVEVANIVGSTPSAVQVAQHRALSRLRESLLAMDTPPEEPDDALTISLVEKTVRTLALAG